MTDVIRSEQKSAGAIDVLATDHVNARRIAK